MENISKEVPAKKTEYKLPNFPGLFGDDHEKNMVRDVCGISYAIVCLSSAPYLMSFGNNWENTVATLVNQYADGKLDISIFLLLLGFPAFGYFLAISCFKKTQQWRNMVEQYKKAENYVRDQDEHVNVLLEELRTGVRLTKPKEQPKFKNNDEFSWGKELEEEASNVEDGNGIEHVKKIKEIILLLCEECSKQSCLYVRMQFAHKIFLVIYGIYFCTFVLTPFVLKAIKTFGPH